jgi:hypothetical protein
MIVSLFFLLFCGNVHAQDANLGKWGVIWVAYSLEGTPRGGTIVITYLGEPRQVRIVETKAGQSLSSIYDAMQKAIDSFTDRSFFDSTATETDISIMNANPATFDIEVKDDGLKLGPIEDTLSEMKARLGISDP